MSTVRARSRTTRLLFVGAATGASAMFVGVGAAPLAAEDLAGGVAWAGLPSALGVVGTAVGATLVTGLLRRGNQRRALGAGYVIGAIGAAVGALSIQRGLFWGLLVGSVLFGIGHAATQLTRYVAAGLHDARRRGRVVGWIVWSATLGGVAGPNLLEPTGRAAAAAGWAQLAGPYLVGAGLMLLVALAYEVVLRPDPSTLAVADDPTDHRAAGPAGEPAPADGDVAGSTVADDADDTRAGVHRPGASGHGSTWRLPAVRRALAIMVTGQVVMVWLMSMTPVHIRHNGGSLRVIGLILSAHILGMYALAPLAGWVEDRVGTRPTAAVALGLLGVAAGLAIVAPAGGPAMGLSLFLLGLGWSFGFVAGSTMLARDVPAPVRTQVQGNVETVVWTSAAFGSVGAGLLLEAVGFDGLAMVALAALALPAGWLALEARAERAATA